MNYNFCANVDPSQTTAAYAVFGVSAAISTITISYSLWTIVSIIKLKENLAMRYVGNLFLTNLFWNIFVLLVLCLSFNHDSFVIHLTDWSFNAQIMWGLIFAVKLLMVVKKVENMERYEEITVIFAYSIPTVTSLTDIFIYMCFNIYI